MPSTILWGIVVSDRLRNLFVHLLTTLIWGFFVFGNSFWRIPNCMIASSNGNDFRVTGLVWGESTGHRWIHLTKAREAELLCFLWSASEHDVTVMGGLSVWQFAVVVVFSGMDLLPPLYRSMFEISFQKWRAVYRHLVLVSTLGYTDR